MKIQTLFIRLIFYLKVGEEYDTEEMGSYNYKILIFKSINELKSRKMTFNCQ